MKVIANEEVKCKAPVLPVCGVKPNLYSEYTLQDHLWNSQALRSAIKVNGAQLDALFDGLLEMARGCVLVQEQYWMKTSINSDLWIKKGSRANTIRDMKNLWIGKFINGFIVTAEVIDTFFSGQLTVIDIDEDGNSVKRIHHIGSVPQLGDIMCIPFGPTFIECNGKKFLNTWANQRVKSHAAHKDKGKLLLRMIYRALCSGRELDSDPAVEADIICEQLLTNNWLNEDFRFLMNYLAALYQRPGINLLTNIWLCGELQGVGKGTLVDVMAVVVGNNLRVKLNQSEVERGWTNALLGKTLIEVDELDTSSRRGWGPILWSNWIKATTIADKVIFTERNFGDHYVINIGNYIFTTNEENPVYLDKSDRRNYFIKTTDNKIWVAYATSINQLIWNVDSEALAAGFAWYLERVDLDVSYISKAHLNEFKAGMQSSWMDEVEEWFKTDEALTRYVSISSLDAYEQYKKWSMNERPGKDILSHTKWGTILGKHIKTNRIAAQKIDKNHRIFYSFNDAVAEKRVDFTEVFQSVEGMFSKVTVPIAAVQSKLATPHDLDVVVEQKVVRTGEMSDLDRLKAKLRSKS